MTPKKESRLSKDLAILMNLGKEDDGSRDVRVTHEELVVVSATVHVGDQVYIERSVCTVDIPADVIGEAVSGVLQQTRAAGFDVMKQTVAITFGTVADRDEEGSAE